MESFACSIGTVYAGYERMCLYTLYVSTNDPCYSGISTGVFTTANADICQYILDNSKAYVIMLDDQRQNINKITKVDIRM